MDRKYYRCAACDSIVYREPGKRHGDGQVDTDVNPVYLYYCDASAEDWAGKEEGLIAAGESCPVITTCGCTEH